MYRIFSWSIITLKNASSKELFGLIDAIKEEYGILPNTKSFNLVLECMNRSKETKAASNLLHRMMETGKESQECLPDEESYSLVICMLLEANLMAPALKCIEFFLNSGYVMSQHLFTECVRYCVIHKNVDFLNTVITECKVLSGFSPTRDILKKVRRCVREMDTESYEQVFYRDINKTFGVYKILKSAIFTCWQEFKLTCTSCCTFEP